jgi:hypothetical protein
MKWPNGKGLNLRTVSGGLHKTAVELPRAALPLRQIGLKVNLNLKTKPWDSTSIFWTWE